MSPPSPKQRRADAFREWYAATYSDLLRFVQRRVHPTYAEDVVAEAFLVAWRRFDELPHSPGDARAFLFGIARHCLLNEQRGDRRRAALGVRLADAAWPPHVGDDAELVARRVDLAAAWRRLTAVHQETLALAVLDGLSASEAAAVLDISPVAYRLRLSRARRALTAHLDHLPDRTHARAGTPERNPR